MSIKFEDKDPAPEIPKAKTIILGGKEMGKVEPHIYADCLTWHAAITIPHNAEVLGRFLLQGHGPSPRAAVAEAVLSARRTVAAMKEKIAWLESELGVAGKSDDEITKLMQGV